ncbi:MAG: hypothetical protein ACC661_12285, partial [Verrucomicrobiales bacterium]
MPSPSEYVLNAEFIPKGGALVVPNRLSFNDLLHLEKTLGRPATYLVEQSSSVDPLLRAHLEREDITALVFTLAQSVEDLKKALNAKIAADELIVFVPGESHWRQASLTTVPSEILKFLSSTGVPLLPLFIDHPVENRLKIEDLRDTDFVVLSFGRLLEREAVNLANYQ